MKHTSQKIMTYAALTAISSSFMTGIFHTSCAYADSFLTHPTHSYISPRTHQDTSFDDSSDSGSGSGSGSSGSGSSSSGSILGDIADALGGAVKNIVDDIGNVVNKIADDLNPYQGEHSTLYPQTGLAHELLNPFQNNPRAGMFTTLGIQAPLEGWDTSYIRLDYFNLFGVPNGNTKGGLLNQLFGNAEKAVSGALSEVGNIAKQAIDSISPTLGKIVSSVGTTIGKILSPLKSIIGNSAQVPLAAFHNMFTAVEAGINAALPPNFRIRQEVSTTNPLSSFEAAIRSIPGSVMNGAMGKASGSVLPPMILGTADDVKAGIAEGRAMKHPHAGAIHRTKTVQPPHHHGNSPSGNMGTLSPNRASGTNTPDVPKISLITH